MRPKLEEMTLREKIGQTGMPSPTHLREGVLECGDIVVRVVSISIYLQQISNKKASPMGRLFSLP